MARRKAKGGAKAAKGSRKTARAAAKSKPSSRRRTPKKKTTARKAGAARKRGSPRVAKRASAAGRRPRRPARRPQLDRTRRTLEETVPTPPSSLDMNRRGSAVRTGRAEMAESLEDHRTMTPAITGGDVDADVENAYFSGDEAPGGDNPTPDQDIVDDIGRSIGVEYQDNEELRGSDKVADRDKHRWELDPASAEDYKERK
jgi:uncharacterized protein DUF6335